MSYFIQTKQRISSILTGGFYGAPVIGTPNDQPATLPFHASPFFATSTPMAADVSQPEPETDQCRTMNDEELLLLEERAALMKAVDELRLRRRAVELVRRKTEDEVRRRAQEEDERRNQTAESLRSLEAERSRLQAEEEAFRRLTEELVRQRVELQAARALLAQGTREIVVRAGLQQHAVQPLSAERERIQEQGLAAVRENPSLREAQAGQTNAQDYVQVGPTLEQRLHAEIGRLAAAQRRAIDASRPQANAFRKANVAHAAAA